MTHRPGLRTVGDAFPPSVIILAAFDRAVPSGDHPAHQLLVTACDLAGHYEHRASAAGLRSRIPAEWEVRRIAAIESEVAQAVERSIRAVDLYAIDATRHLRRDKQSEWPESMGTVLNRYAAAWFGARHEPLSPGAQGLLAQSAQT